MNKLKLLPKLKRFILSIWYKLRSFVIVLERPIINTSLNLIMLFVTIITLTVAIKTLDNADKQFQENSHSSDSLFNIQLDFSKKLNDSLINQIGLLQKLTNNQISITDRQLKVWEKIAKEEYDRRPKLSIQKGMFGDYDSTQYILDGLFVQNGGNIEAKIDRIVLDVPSENLIYCEIENATKDYIGASIYRISYAPNGLTLIAGTGKEIKAKIIYKKIKNEVPRIEYAIHYWSPHESGVKRWHITFSPGLDAF